MADGRYQLLLAAALAALPGPAPATREGSPDGARATIAITASVPGQARLAPSAAAGLCVWTNTAVRSVALLGERGPVAHLAEQPGNGCATGLLGTRVLPAGPGAVVLVSPD